MVNSLFKQKRLTKKEYEVLNIDKTQYYIPCLKVGDIIKSNYNLRLTVEQEHELCISTLISPLLYQIQRVSGKKTSRPKNVIQVEAPHNKKKHDEYRILFNEGFYYNGIKFLRFGKSASQSKDGITVFVSEDIYDELMMLSMLDIDVKDENLCIPKYEAQRCLIFSTCTFLNMPIPKIVIIDSYSTLVKNQRIKYVEDVERTNDSGGIYKVKEIKEGVRDVKIAPWDGCGCHRKWIGEVAQEEFELDYRPSGLQIRLPFMKGFSVEFDFEQWFRENGVAEIVDVFGNSHKVEDIDCIWNIDMWKAHSLFKGKFGNDGIVEYFKLLDKYEYKLGVSKYSHHIDHINVMARMNFQYLQCLDMWNEKYMAHFDRLYSGESSHFDFMNNETQGVVVDFAKYSTDLFGKICGGSKFHTMKFMGVDNSDDEDITSDYLKAVMINEDMLKDPCVKRFIKRKAQKKIDEMKLGKCYASGFYHTVFGDMIGYLQYACRKEPTGVLGWGEFYADTIFENNQDVLSFRSPLVCPSEVNKVKVRNDLEEKWFGHFKGQDVCMLNMYDLSMPIQGGMKWCPSSLWETVK